VAGCVLRLEIRWLLERARMVGEEAVKDQSAAVMKPLNEAGKTWAERRRSEAQWYVVEAKEGKDFDVCLKLVSAGFECWRPVEKVVVTRRVMVEGVMKPMKTEKKIAIFGRYVFLHHVMSPFLRSAVVDTPGVAGFVCMAGTEEPASVPNELVEFYRKGLKSSGEDEARFAPTDKVRIAVGPATGVIGVVKSVSNMAARLESRDGVWNGPLVVPLDHLELVEKGVGRAASTKKRNAPAHV
jgi:transcription antitermination factor NusG